MAKEEAQKHFEKGNEQFNKGNYLKAIEHYTNAIKINPDYAEAYYNRGIAKRFLKKYKEAILDFTEAIKINPDYAEAYNNRGIAKRNLGNYEEAIVDYTKAININPKFAEAYYNRGNNRTKLKKFDEANQDFAKLIDIQKEKSKENKLLYQYMSISREKLLSLVNQELYFADYTKLNDPFECYFMQKSWISELPEQYKKTARILALTYDNESQLMYSHYAKEHTGICVGYRIYFDEFTKDEEISYGNVKYKKINNIETLEDLYMLKSEKWQYEKEYRLVRFDNKEFINNIEIKEIIFALNCTQEHKKIVYSLTKNNEQIIYRQVVKDKNSNALKIKEIKKQRLEHLKKIGIKELEIDNNELYKLMLKNNLDSLYHYHKEKNKK